MRVDAARAVIMVMFVLITIVVMVIAAGGEVPQMHARQRLNRNRCSSSARQHARQESFHVRADPVEQVDVLNTPYVGRAQCVIMRRRPRWKEDFRHRDAVLNGRCNQLQRLDAGQHANLGLGGSNCGNTGDEYDKK